MFLENIDVDPDVEGSVTIAVRQQPWKQVLDRIVREHGLHVRHVGGIYYVSTSPREAVKCAPAGTVHNAVPAGLDDGLYRGGSMLLQTQTEKVRSSFHSLG